MKDSFVSHREKNPRDCAYGIRPAGGPADDGRPVLLATKFLKEEEMEAVKMMAGMNAFGKLYCDDGVRDGKAAGFIQAFCLMVRDGLLRLEDVAKRTDTSVEDFREKMQEQQEEEQETTAV